MLVDTLRLNVGGGADHRAGYINVDLREDVADVVAPADQLPYDDGTVSEILAMDILEHFPPFRTQDVLAEWRRVLAPGGRLTVRVPNLLALAKAIVNDTAPVLMIRNIYGGHRWGIDGSLDCHHTGWTPLLLFQELANAGFTVVDSDSQLNMTFDAVKAETTGGQR